MRSAQASPIQGSSPLTRGKLGRCELSHVCLRLIPAHAGKTLVPASRMVIGGAHPRSRGENTRSSCSRSARAGSSPLTRGKRNCPGRRRKRQGSSPLTRGKPSVALAFLRISGLIPAHAGKTAVRSGSGSCRPAHPRSRGENSAPQALRPSPGGSSPLTRGKLDAAATVAGTAGLIPAHAGKTPNSGRSALRGSAHPRSRGENMGVP